MLALLVCVRYEDITANSPHKGNGMALISEDCVSTWLSFCYMFLLYFSQSQFLLGSTEEY